MKQHPLSRNLRAIALVALLAPAAWAERPAVAAPAPRADAAIEPRAVDLLKQMSARLAGAPTLQFTAVSTYESPTHQGPPLTYATKSEVTLQRPDKLRVMTLGDGPASEFYLDGTRMVAFAPGENLAAVSEAPMGIDAALESAYGTAAIYFPFMDVLVTDPYADLAKGLKRAYFVGPSKVVGDSGTNIVAIANEHLFAQIWIGQEDQLPRRIRAIYLDDPARLRHQVDFTDWKLGSAVPAETFASEAAKAARSIPFARPDPRPPTEAAPQTAKPKSQP